MFLFSGTVLARILNSCFVSMSVFSIYCTFCNDAIVHYLARYNVGTILASTVALGVRMFFVECQVKKSKACPRTGHEGPERE